MTGAAEPIVRDTTRFSGWRIMALATITLGLTGPGQTIGVSVFIDHFADTLDLSKNAISAGYAIGTLCGSLTLPTVGRLVDRYGVRRAMTTIGALFALGLTYMSGVQGLVTLTIGFFFIRMLGQGSLSLASTVAISRWFDRRRGLALGIAMTISSALMALVPVALSFVIDEVGWRQAWLVAAGTIALVVVPVSWFGIIDRPSAVGQFPDGEPPTDHTDDVEEWGVERSEAVRIKRDLMAATGLRQRRVVVLVVARSARAARRRRLVHVARSERVRDEASEGAESVEERIGTHLRVR